ncbi:MAG: tripartite tricarboxylate transporter substrate binding protein [Xanthobacteraceae bacterium]
MVDRRNILAFGLTLASGSILRSPLYAQDYPTRPVTIIVPAAAGSPSDFPARLASQVLPQRLGQPVVVEYRPGAAGAIGARAAAAAAPDGYTLFIGNSSTLAAIPAVSAHAGYDPVKDFTPIVEIMRSFQILVVDPSSPWKTVGDLVAYAKANPGKLNCGNTGTGGLPDLAAQLFMLRTGTKMTGVSFRGGNQSVTAIMGHVIDLTFETGASIAPLIRAGKLRALAVQNDVRSPLFLDVPTMAEAGVADCLAQTFFGLVGPAGTSPAIVTRINAAINAGMQTPQMQQMVANVSSENKPNTPAEFAAFIAANSRKWVQVAEAAHIKLD